MKKVLFIIFTLFITEMNAQTTNKQADMQQIELNTKWEFSQAGLQSWLPATVPGTVHTDLLANKKIEEPYYRVNERNQQWIDKVNWEYKTVFNVSEEIFKKSNIILDFKGLDTYADVYLNNEKILSANNMFREWTVDAKRLLKRENNELRIYFHSPVLLGLQMQEKFGYRLPAVNDQSEVGGLGENRISIFTRKAGYHYGWDWGPRFVTSGIWRPVYLKAWNNCSVEDVFIRQKSISKTSANLETQIELNATGKQSLKIQIEVNDKTIAEKQIEVSAGTSKQLVNVEIKNPKLWWSNGLGEAYLYKFNVKIFAGDNLLDHKELNYGIRTIKVIQKPDNDGNGKSFYFELNGIPVFAKGANYIPNDIFLPTVTSERYEHIVKSAVDANMNMLRVWGGGIYENDLFYDLCDKYGVFVWQDFMFACAMYPGGDEFYENIRQEFIQNTKRLRNHAAMAIWCGNNEILAAWPGFDEKANGWGWKADYNDLQKKQIWDIYLKMFHDILPKVISEYTDNGFYWASSPSAEYEKAASYENRSGDMHYWGVWHGKHPFSDFKKYSARFMSEYGFQSFPEFNTVRKYTVPTDWDITSDVMASHQRSGIGNLRIKEYMESMYKMPKDFESFLYASQVLQAEAIKSAMENHRMKMPYCMGTLFWQINDCWPVASWSSIDYYGNWKALQYFAKKAYTPILVSPSMENGKLSVFVISDKLEEQKANLEMAIYDFNGKSLWNKTIAVKIAPNTSQVYFEIPIDELTKGFNQKTIYFYTRLMQKDQPTVDNILYFVFPKDLELPTPKISKTITKTSEGYEVILSTDKLAKNVFLSLEEQTGSFSDNYFDLEPNKPVKILYKNSKPEINFENKLKIRSLIDCY